MPPELRAGLDWQNFSTPYRPGGLNDQPIRFTRRLRWALRVFHAVDAWKNKYTPTTESDRAWHSLHADDMKILQALWTDQNGR